jgi:hypothetical protein
MGQSQAQQMQSSFSSRLLDQAAAMVKVLPEAEVMLLKAATRAVQNASNPAGPAASAPDRASTGMQRAKSDEAVSVPQGGAVQSPTIADFTMASVWALIPGASILPPPGFKKLEQNGVPMEIRDPSTGVLGRAWVTPNNQVIVSYMATNPLQPAYLSAQVDTDIEIFSGKRTKAETQGTAFAEEVARVAQAQGISRENVFLTGDSLGGTLAQRASQETGLGGVGFVPTGVSPVEGQGSGDNFISIVGLGDPWSTHSAAFAKAQPGISTTAEDGSQQRHFGTVVTTGLPILNDLLAKATGSFVSTARPGEDVRQSYAGNFLGVIQPGVVDLDASPGQGVERFISTAALMAKFVTLHVVPPLVESVVVHGDKSIADLAEPRSQA